ncbi:MAG: V-type ATP synthase subunit D [Marine Group III euryarchaeote CG-Epi1]|jgi:V/A-type H+-transporting ATPase subunit D|uniref:A-type ATP synthase subunit D n=1 Tax=Marine Group III euryarchaeote CG-Epi1 TaxID=1888995 RepID=A0A1J5TKG6_9ARCH|nr:MAG: V-type ATP synthase subunit D [Marine Group III euryarchaeote CG-Epi1]|tara:strand:+ start:113 stop:730 length:618 start_codon:yes stop_codon:yes gene_type:complete
MSTSDVKPTRMELIETKRKIKLSKSGYKLLKMKRDGLIMEFFELLPKVKDLRSQLSELYSDAMEKLAIAVAADGKTALESAANCLNKAPEVELSSKNIMGVVVPSVEVTAVEKSLEDRGYGLIGTSIRVDEAVHAFEKLSEMIILAAEGETTMKKLLDEIESTKRRVNALEFKVIPNLEEIAKYISFRLEELERESIFGLKRIKG